MGDSYRRSRTYRDRDDDQDEDRFKSTTVTRYKVTPSRAGDRYERSERPDPADDDGRSRFSASRPSPEFLDDRLSHTALDRPRSEYEPTMAERPRSVYHERDMEREIRREPDRSRVSVYDDWDRRSYRDTRDPRYEDEIRVERRTEERLDDDRGHEVERYRKETEYYVPAEPPPAPVIIRQQAQEPQKIIVQEAPSPAPIVVPRQQPGVVVVRDRELDREMVRRERDPFEQEYYYRHERRDVGPYRGGHDYTVSRYERRDRDDYSYYSDDDDYYVRRTVIRRERSESPHRHKRELAEGALAGAGLTALMSSRRDEYGDLPENRGRKVLAGAALGALGTEALRRAHSAYGDRLGDGRESPDHHSRLKKGLGFAAVALAAAGAAKYYQSNKVEKEEAHRGRSRNRGGYYSDDYSRSASRSSHSRPRARSSRRRSLSTIAKAALGTAATAGIVKHFRDKSKSRAGSQSRSRSRSKSRIRRGAEIAGVAAAAGVANKLWKNHQDRKESRTRSVSRDDGGSYHGRSRGRDVSRSRSWGRSRSRSMARSPVSPSAADAELGLVEYGGGPLPSERSSAAGGYGAGGDGGRRRRRRRRDRTPSSPSSPADQERKRSRSRLRNMAAAGAAAVGIKEFKNRRDREKHERRSRERESGQRRHVEERRDEEYFDDRRSRRAQSPPMASGGAYFPPYPSTPGAAPGGPEYAPYSESPGAPPREYQPYVPQDYTGYAPPAPPGPPPPGHPSGPEPSVHGGYPFVPPGPPPPGPAPPPGGRPPPPGGRPPPDQVSHHSRRRRRGRAVSAAEDGLISPYSASSAKGPPSATKSVSFIPLSPKSSRTLERHRRQHGAASDEDANSSELDDEATDGDGTRPAIRRRRSSDPSSDRPVVSRRNLDAVSFGSDDVELLPDRFDSQGKPIGARSVRDGWTTRQGTFERPPQQAGDWTVRGAWQVGGTDGQAVDQLVRSFTEALDGRRSWVHVLGDVLGGAGVLARAPSAGDNEGGREGDELPRRVRRR